MKKLLLVAFITLSFSVAAQNIGDRYKNESGNTFTIVNKTPTTSDYLYTVVDSKGNEISMNTKGISEMEPVVIPVGYGSLLTEEEVSSSYMKYDKNTRIGKTLLAVGAGLLIYSVVTKQNTVMYLSSAPLFAGMCVFTFTCPIPNKIRKRHK